MATDRVREIVATATAAATEGRHTVLEAICAACLAAIPVSGVALALMEQAEKQAVAQGLHVLRVDTNSENAATQQLFPKLGYRFAGEIGLAFRPGLRFFCYEKQLP